MKIYCICGHTNNFTTDTEHELFLLNESLLFDIEEKIDDGLLDGDQMHDEILEKSLEVYRCEKCSRMYMFGEKNGKKIRYLYALEEMWEEGDEEEDKD